MSGAAVLVPADDVRRHLGWPRLDPVELLRAQAAEHGLELQVSEDWAGRPCVPAEQAAALVRAVTAREVAATREGRRREHAVQVAKAEEDAYLTERARAVFEHVVERTGDYGAGESLAYVAGKGNVTDQQLGKVLEVALGRWSAGYRSFEARLQPGHEPVAVPVNVDQLHALEEVREINRTGSLTQQQIGRLAEAVKPRRKFRP
jgi:hypothetical protein